MLADWICEKKMSNTAYFPAVTEMMVTYFTFNDWGWNRAGGNAPILRLVDVLWPPTEFSKPVFITPLFWSSLSGDGRWLEKEISGGVALCATLRNSSVF